MAVVETEGWDRDLSDAERHRLAVERYEAAMQAPVGRVGVFMDGCEVVGIGRVGRYAAKSGRYYLDGVPGLRKAGTAHWNGPRRGHDNGGAWAEVALLAYLFDDETAARDDAGAADAARRQFEPLIRAVEEEYARRVRELVERRDALVEAVHREQQEAWAKRRDDLEAALAQAAGHERLRLEHRFWLYGRPYEGRVSLGG